MGMQYHKIRGIPLDVCTAEQKIAYNLAFNAHIGIGDKYRQARKISTVCADDLLRDRLMIEWDAWKRQSNGKYNDDAIYSCLLAGLAEYLMNPFIAADYESIGKAFPAHYLN